MIGTIRSEQIKLRTVLMHWVLAVIAVGFPLLVTLLNAGIRADDGDFDARSLVEVLSGTSVVGILLIGVIAAASVTGEFGFNTIRPTLAATPRRARVVTAKAIVVVVLALALQGLVLLVGWFVGAGLAEGRGATIDLGTVDGGIEALLGSLVFALMMALVGLGLGLIVRSTPAAVAAIILWPLLVENLLGGLLSVIFDGTNIASWMPFRAGLNLLAVDSIGDGPSRMVGGIYFGAFALVLLGLGTWLLHRRDA